MRAAPTIPYVLAFSALLGLAACGADRSGDARDGEARNGEARSGEARSGEARTGDARNGDALTDAARSDAERTGRGSAAADAIAAIEPVTEPAAAAAAIPASGEARMDGYGALRFGMSTARARDAWTGNPLEPGEGAGDATACHHLWPAGQPAPADLAFMFEGDAFVRYSVESAEHTAPGGGRVGMDRSALQGLYGGRLEESPHKYVEGGSVLSSREDGGEVPSRLVFELDAAGVVTEWRVGVAPQVGYVEGCS